MYNICKYLFCSVYFLAPVLKLATIALLFNRWTWKEGWWFRHRVFVLQGASTPRTSIPTGYLEIAILPTALFKTIECRVRILTLPVAVGWEVPLRYGVARDGQRRIRADATPRPRCVQCCVVRAVSQDKDRRTACNHPNLSNFYSLIIGNTLWSVSKLKTSPYRRGWVTIVGLVTY